MNPSDIKTDNSTLTSVTFTYAANPWGDREIEFVWNLSMTVNVYNVDYHFRTTQSREIDVFTWSTVPTLEEVVERCDEWMEENVYVHYVDGAF